MSIKLSLSFSAVCIVIVLVFLTAFETSSLDPATELPSTVTEQVIPEIKFSYEDILANDEFKTGMQKAVVESDIELAKSLQAKVIEIADAAQLPESEMQILSGDRGLNYMQFLAKRQLFMSAFERRYMALEGIQDIKLIYPEAQNLFARSDALIAKRDQMILEIAKQMAGESEVEDYLQQAKAQWLSIQKSQ